MGQKVGKNSHFQRKGELSLAKERRSTLYSKIGIVSFFIGSERDDSL